MSDIPFIKELDFDYGRAARVSPLIRRLVANNPGPYTLFGTGTYIVGHGQVAVIDPGPADPGHIDALMATLEGETVTHILITHTHMDHSPGAALLKARTGAPTYGFGPHGGGIGAGPAEEGADRDFRPDILLGDGDVIEGAGWTIEAVHTPGHLSNHLCFALREEKALFSGDHVMGWSTSIVSPPDGDMAAYMASLKKLLDRDETIYWPTHGDAIRAPKPFVKALIRHREAREEQILAELREGAKTIPGLVASMYRDVPAFLHPAAARSVLAHLIHMVETGRIKADGAANEGATYRL